MTKDNDTRFSRVDINVPFVEKDRARELGARWDAKKSTWYVPPGVDKAAFARWIAADKENDPPPEPNVKADYFFLAKANNVCWRCNEVGKVFALFLPEGFTESHYEDEDDPENDDMFWEAGAGIGSLEFVEAVNTEVASVLAEHAPGYTRDFSKTTSSFYLMNHCPHCKASQGDFFLHEMGGAFLPTTEEGCKSVTVKPFKVAIEASASVGWSSVQYELMYHELGPDGFAARLQSNK